MTCSFIIGFVCLTFTELLLTCKYLLSFTAKSPLILYFELLFSLEKMSFFFVISLIFSCYSISVLVAYLMIKCISMFSHVSTITNHYIVISKNNLTLVMLENYNHK